MKAIDYSSFSTGGPVPVSVFNTIRAMFPSGDMLLNIPGAWHGSSGYAGARQSILNGRDAGFQHSATYVVVNQRPGKETVERAQGFIGADEWSKLSFAAIDVELGTKPEIVGDAFLAIAQSGIRPVIYTSKYMWSLYMADTTAFSDLPLWNALYDNDSDYDFARYPYGGWNIRQLGGEQYTNTTLVSGYGFDFNQFRDEFVKAEPAPVGDPLALLVQAWRDDMALLAVNAADLIHTPFDKLRLALHSIYTARRTADWKALLAS
jgi:hypothetical protein